MRKVDISFVIPAKNEQRNVSLLYEQITNIQKSVKKTYEIIFVDDGSTDNTHNELKKLQNKDKRVKLVKHRSNWGKSKALQSGFDVSKGDIVITMDADLQDNPKKVPNFIKKIESGYDLVNGWKKKRKDSFSITIPSKIGNFLISKLTGLEIHDLNCGFKAYKRKTLKHLNIYGELYRFIPILLHQKGFKITEIPVPHRRRKYGKSKYKHTKALKILIDLITVLFLSGYSSQPAHFFGSIGIVLFTAGFIMDSYVTYIKLTTGTTGGKIPLLIAGVLFILLGVQIFFTGLIAEMIVNLDQRNKNAS